MFHHLLGRLRIGAVEMPGQRNMHPRLARRLHRILMPPHRLAQFSAPADRHGEQRMMGDQDASLVRCHRREAVEPVLQGRVRRRHPFVPGPDGTDQCHRRGQRVPDVRAAWPVVGGAVRPGRTARGLERIQISAGTEADDTTGQKAWEKLPQLMNYQTTGKPKPGAIVLGDPIYVPRDSEGEGNTKAPSRR